MTFLKIERALVIFLFIASYASMQAQDGSETQHLMLESKALAGNSIGDSSIRSVSVYLPPAYATSPARDFPVLYLLHGYTDSNAKWFGQKDHWINLPVLIDSIDLPEEDQFIVVMPNAYNTFHGSMYSNSSTTGNWEDFISEELVAHMDENYRTIKDPAGRGLAGHSMGGYGTVKIGMKNADVFGALYMMSPCCLENSLPTNAGLIKNLLKVTDPSQFESQPFFVRISLAAAAAWSPNPNKPPMYIDFPFDENGEAIDSIAQRFKSHEIIPNLSTHLNDLQELDQISIDVGSQDFMIRNSAETLHQELEKLGIENAFEIYEGDHTNQIGQRLGSDILPHFADYFREGNN